ncbi:MAG: YbhN family protein [Candidatus Altiarchaeota archaeon]
MRSIISLAKIIVFILAVWYLIKYLTLYDIPSQLSKVNPAYLLISMFFSACAFLLQAWFLKRASNGGLTIRDSVYVEFYTLILNLGVASSFFSLPKVAFINNKVKNLKESVRLFSLPLLLGTALRVTIIMVAGLFVYFRVLPALVSASIILTIFLSVLYGPFRSRLERMTKTPSNTLAELSAVAALNVLCVALSYYFVITSLAENPPIPNTIFSEGVGYLTGLLSPMPSGIGVREFALTELNGVMGITKDVAFTAAVLHRLITVAATFAATLAFYIKLPGCDTA